MRFLNRQDIRQRFEGKRVAIVGSGPGVLNNDAGFVDAHDVVLRVNNYKLSEKAGFRTDVFYSFFGTSIKKTAQELKRDGVNLCMCKCPNAHAIKSEWHKSHNQMIGVDYRPHYEKRKSFWFCDTYIPTTEEFLKSFELLGGHIPTTGFAAILDVVSFNPSFVYLTGFDFFSSGVHNVDELWRRGNANDPIKHVPEKELEWIRLNKTKLPMAFDNSLTRLLF